jgi:hypothetical protein
MPLVQRATHSVDPQLALAQVRTLQDVLDRASAQMAFTMVLVAIAASVALMLGGIGIFGVSRDSSPHDARPPHVCFVWSQPHQST